MIKHYGVPITIWLYSYAVLLFVCLVLMTLVLSIVTEPSFFSIFRSASALSVFAVGLLCRPKIYDTVVKNLPKALTLPNLNGEYRMSCQTNWPLLDPNGKYQQSYKETGQLPHFSEVVDNEFFYNGTMTFQMSLFRITGQYTPDENPQNRSRSGSILKSCGLDFDEESQQYNFSYVYDAHATGAHARTDSARHYGAGWVTFADKFPRELRGCYWTNRSWQQGLNTAGFVCLERL